MYIQRSSSTLTLHHTFSGQVGASYVFAAVARGKICRVVPLSSAAVARSLALHVAFAVVWLRFHQASPLGRGAAGPGQPVLAARLSVILRRREVRRGAPADMPSLSTDRICRATPSAIMSPGAGGAFVYATGDFAAVNNNRRVIRAQKAQTLSRTFVTRKQKSLKLAIFPSRNEIVRNSFNNSLATGLISVLLFPVFGCSP